MKTARERIALLLAQFGGVAIGGVLGALASTDQLSAARIGALLVASGAMAGIAYIVSDGEWGKR